MKHINGFPEHVLVGKAVSLNGGQPEIVLCKRFIFLNDALDGPFVSQFFTATVDSITCDEWSKTDTDEDAAYGLMHESVKKNVKHSLWQSFGTRASSIDTAPHYSRASDLEVLKEIYPTEKGAAFLQRAIKPSAGIRSSTPKPYPDYKGILPTWLEKQQDYYSPGLVGRIDYGARETTVLITEIDLRLKYGYERSAGYGTESSVYQPPCYYMMGYGTDAPLLNGPPSPWVRQGFGPSTLKPARNIYSKHGRRTIAALGG